MSRELQAADQMGPHVVLRSLGPTLGVGDGGSGGQAPNALVPGRAPLLDLFHMVEDMPEIDFGKNNSAAKNV